eukprot:5556236-Prymnesium_polylepis.1
MSRPRNTRCKWSVARTCLSVSSVSHVERPLLTSAATDLRRLFRSIFVQFDGYRPYDKHNVTPSYGQFGAGHMVDDFLREYKLISNKSHRSVDLLPFDLQNVEKHVLMIVRV